MTSASELFYNRRSRYSSRTTNHDLGLDSLPPSPDRSQNRRHHNNHEPDGCDPLLRRHLRHRISLSERAALGLDLGGTHLGSGNGAGGAAGGPGGLSGSERLPGSVVLARQRLLERLRGMPPSETRHRRALNIYGSGLVHGDDSSLVDVRDWGAEILTGRSASGYASTNLNSQIERLQLLQDENKKPAGLNQEVLNCLSPEIFCSTEMGVDGLVLRASRDCSICLETFIDGDELICLPCAHRFHAACLGPWVQIRGDCPYCRRVIVVDSHVA